MKTLFIFTISCGLLLMGPGPTSLCSLLSSMTGECAAPENHSHCENMDSDTPPVETLAARSSSCCAAVQPPLPELRNELAKFAVQIVDVVSADATGEVVRIPHTLGEDVLIVDSYPPRLQPVLCTFLI